MGKTYYSPVGIYHTVTALEDGSGLVRMSTTGYQHPDTPPSPTKEFMFVAQMRSGNNSGVIKPNIITNYDIGSGVIHIEDGTDVLVTGDTISVVGMFYS